MDYINIFVCFVTQVCVRALLTLYVWIANIIGRKIGFYFYLKTTI